MFAAHLGLTLAHTLHAASVYGLLDLLTLPAGLAAALLLFRDRLSPSVLQQIEERVGVEPDGNWTLSNLAGLVHLSRYHFAREFKQTTGQTVHGYVLERRLRRCYELLLATDFPLGRIASDAGFADQSHFARRFRAHFGLTPGALRKSPR